MLAYKAVETKDEGYVSGWAYTWEKWRCSYRIGGVTFPPPGSLIFCYAALEDAQRDFPFAPVLEVEVPEDSPRIDHLQPDVLAEHWEDNWALATRTNNWAALGTFCAGGKDMILASRVEPLRLVYDPAVGMIEE